MQLSRDRDVLKTPHGILLKSLSQADAGLYHCLATENNFKHTIARVSLRILDRQIAVALTSPDEEEQDDVNDEHKSHQRHHNRDREREHSSPGYPAQGQNPTAQSWPNDPLPSQAEVMLIHQYCQSYLEQLGAQQQQKNKLKSRRHTENQASSGG